jgi:hypothetical protein
MISDRRGAASLELLIVLVPWMIVVFIFFNLLFLLSSLMINQSAVNRAAQQVAAVSCLPQGLEQSVVDSAIGVNDVNDVKFVAVASAPLPNGRANPIWNRDAYINTDGRAKTGTGSDLRPCAPGNAELISSNYIYVQLQYKQTLPITPCTLPTRTQRSLPRQRLAKSPTPLAVSWPISVISLGRSVNQIARQ